MTTVINYLDKIRFKALMKELKNVSENNIKKASSPLKRKIHCNILL